MGGGVHIRIAGGEGMKYAVIIFSFYLQCLGKVWCDKGFSTRTEVSVY